MAVGVWVTRLTAGDDHACGDRGKCGGHVHWGERDTERDGGQRKRKGGREVER